MPSGDGQSLLYSKIKNKERKSSNNVIVICYKATDEDIQKLKALVIIDNKNYY